MAVTTIGSEEARLHWRDTVETAYLGDQVIVHRGKRPTVVMIGYQQWQKMTADLERVARLERLLRSRQRYEQRSTPGSFVNQEEYEVALKAAGIDE